MQTTILFADDQIPDDSVADEDIRAVYSAKWPGDENLGFVRAYEVMRGVVQALRDRNCEVTVANTYKRAMRLAATRHFDIAIIDLGWADDSLKESAKDSAGWTIAHAIERADKKRSTDNPTARIIYSSRFAAKPEISVQAGKEGILPFFKVYRELDSRPVPIGQRQLDTDQSPVDLDAINRSSLAAAVGFIENLLHARTTEINAAGLGILDEARKSANRWDTITISCMLVSVALVALSVIFVVVFNRPATIVSAIAGAITAMIQTLFLSQLKASRERIVAAWKSLVELSPRSPSG